MAQTLRVSLAGTNALEASPDVRDYALLADADNILIKEHSRGTVAGSGSVTHNIGYLPHFYAYGEISAGRFQIANGYNAFGDFRSSTNTTDLSLTALIAGTPDMRYFIFYDDIPS